MTLTLRIALVLTLTFAASSVCLGGTTMDNDSIWPTDVSGWKWDGERKTFDRNTLYEYIDGAAEVYLAYDFQQVTVRRYEKRGSPPIVAELYAMATSADAFGIFAFEQHDPDAGIGQESEFGGGFLRFWKDRYFVSILADGEGEAVEAAALELGRALAHAITTTGEPPALLQSLPDIPSATRDRRLCFVHSHILLNRCFFISHQNILGLNREVNALLARYRRGETKVQVLLIAYPSATAAGSALTSFKNAYMPEATDSGIVRTEDGLWTKALQAGKHILIIFGASRVDDANSIAEATEARLTKEETWKKKEQ